MVGRVLAPQHLFCQTNSRSLAKHFPSHITAAKQTQFREVFVGIDCNGMQNRSDTQCSKIHSDLPLENSYKKTSSTLCSQFFALIRDFRVEAYSNDIMHIIKSKQHVCISNQQINIVRVAKQVRGSMLAIVADKDSKRRIFMQAEACQARLALG